MEKIKNFLFVNTSNKQTVIKNTLWLFLGELGIRLLKLVIFIFAARKLGVTEWGIFSYALALMSFFSIISDIGLNSVLLKKTVQNNNEEQSQFISTSFFLKLGLSIISGLALLSLTIFFKNDNLITSLIPITALLLFLEVIREFGFSLNRAFEKMEVEAIIKIFATIILTIIGIILIKIKPVAASLLYAYIISSTIEIFILYFNLKKHFQKLIRNFKKNLLYIIWKEAWPIGLAGAIGTIMINTDMIILGWFQSPEQIGIYSTSQKLIQLLYLLPMVISTATLPIFSRLATTDIEKMRSIIKRMLKISFKFTIPIVAICFLFGGPVIILLFGEQYTESILIFKIMSFAIITGIPGAIISNAMFVEGKQKKLIQFIILSLIINIIFCLLTIPRFGIYGAAISATFAQTIGYIFLIKKYNKLLN